MDFLNSLHGAVATVLLGVLLFVDEAGLPLPFIPNEVLLLAAGLLMASGSLSPFVFYPVAGVALIGGSWTGYTWADRVGPERLRRVAARLHATRAFDRATRRLVHADAWHVAVARMIPGIRPYATLTAGAGGVPLRTFMTGNVPAILLWLALLSGLGYVAGVPAERFLTAVEVQLFNIALSGALLVVLGLAAYRAARRAPASHRSGAAGIFSVIAGRDRHWLAFAIDAGIVAVIVAGLDRLTRVVLHLRVHILPDSGRYDVLAIILAVALVYIVASRRSPAGETAGERLFDVSYVHPRRAHTQSDDDEDATA